MPVLQTPDNPTNNLSKPTTPADIVEAIKYIIHGCDRSRPDVTVPAASQHIVGKYICDQFITPLREEIAQLKEDKMHLEGQLSYLMWAPTEGGRRNNPVQTNPPPAVPTTPSNAEPHMFTALGKIWISHNVGDNKCPVGCTMSSRALTETYTVIRGGSASINWENKIGWYPVDKHGNDLPSGAVYKFKAAVLAGKKVEFYDSTPSAWYGVNVGWFADMDNKASTNIADAKNPDCYRIVEDTPTPQPTLTPSDKDRIALAKWFASSDTGISSRAMAAVYLAGCNVFDKGTDNTPRDAPDLGRCIRLVALCPDILRRPTVYTLGQQHPVWREYLDHWTHLVTLFNKGDYHVTTGYMDVLRDYAKGKAKYTDVIAYYRKHTVDPLQHIQAALKAGRQVQQFDHKDLQWYYIQDTKNIYPDYDTWYINPDNYRILLNHTDITPTTVFRNKGVTMGYVTVSEVAENGVYFTNNVKQIVPWNILVDTAEYSHDGVTWKPCLVPQPK